MSQTLTTTETVAFTVTHARHLASKVATDLKRVQRFYDQPTDAEINEYEMELIELLREGYLSDVTYGFKRNGRWIVPTLTYTAQELAANANDDDPGRIRPGAIVDGAAFSSYLNYSAAWERLSPAAKEAFKKRLPFRRVGATQPGMDGYLVSDLSYSSGGRALSRSTLKAF